MDSPLLTIIGARPQFIKAAMVSRALAKQGDLREILAHTGQHYDANMSTTFFEELEIPEPHFNLGIGSGSHGAQTGRMMEALENVCLDQSPSAILVYGDTNTTMAGALVGAKLHIPVAHVEAGLRSNNRKMPEEINRIVTDHVSELLFAPTDEAHRNLLREGVPESRIAVVGDVMYDAALHFGEIGKTRSKVLFDLGLEPQGYVLATIHRAENTDDPKRLGVLLGALATVSKDLSVVLPLHPRTRSRLEAATLRVPESVKVVEPLGYLDMAALEQFAAVIATDSGGVQKEAFFYRVPCVTLRDETEWVELLELGWNRLAPPTSEAEVAEAILGARGRVGEDGRPYGDGEAGERIAARLAELVRVPAGRHSI